MKLYLLFPAIPLLSTALPTPNHQSNPNRAQFNNAYGVQNVIDSGQVHHRKAYPWENPNNVYDRPGHTAPFHLSQRDCEDTSSGPCKSCVPYVGAPDQTYIPGFGGQDLIRRPLPNDNQPFTMSLMHTNDIHARMDEFAKNGLDCIPSDYDKKECYGGIARIKTVVDHIRATEKNTYLFDAGDQFQGTMFYSYYKGNVTAEFMNAIKYDVFAVGNHEFDDGPAHLSKFLRKIDAPAISSNLDVSVEPDLKGLIAPYVVMTKYGTRIGIVGFITKTLADIGNIGKHLRFSDPVAPVQRAVDELHSLGIHRIICVSHNGYQDDMDLARQTRGFDLIVGGHSHTLLHNSFPNVPQSKGPYPTKVTNLDGKNTYIVQAKMWGEWLGHLSISWDACNELTHLNGEPIHLTMDIAQESTFSSIVKKWRQPFEFYSNQILGTNPTELSNQPCKVGHCGLGWFVADAMRASYRGSQGNANPVIGLMHEGGLRASLREGNVSLYSILTILPFPDPIMETTVSGEWIRGVMENLAAFKNQGNGRRVTTFAQFAGARGSIDKSKPDFQKVSNIQIQQKDGQWAPINLQGQYIVVMPSFIARGGDNAVPEQKQGGMGEGPLSDILTAHVRKVKAIAIPNDPGFN